MLPAYNSESDKWLDKETLSKLPEHIVAVKEYDKYTGDVIIKEKCPAPKRLRLTQEQVMDPNLMAISYKRFLKLMAIKKRYEEMNELKTKSDVYYSLNLPLSVVNKIDQACDTQEKSVREIITEAVERYLKDDYNSIKSAESSSNNF